MIDRDIRNNSTVPLVSRTRINYEAKSSMLSSRCVRFDAHPLRVKDMLHPLLLLLIDTIGVSTDSEWDLKQVASVLKDNS